MSVRNFNRYYEIRDNVVQAGLSYFGLTDWLRDYTTCVSRTHDHAAEQSPDTEKIRRANRKRKGVVTFHNYDHIAQDTAVEAYPKVSLIWPMLHLAIIHWLYFPDRDGRTKSLSSVLLTSHLQYLYHFQSATSVDACLWYNPKNNAFGSTNWVTLSLKYNKTNNNNVNK